MTADDYQPAPPPPPDGATGTMKPTDWMVEHFGDRNEFGETCMCIAEDLETGSVGWRPCPTHLCERADHDHSDAPTDVSGENR